MRIPIAIIGETPAENSERDNYFARAIEADASGSLISPPFPAGGKQAARDTAAKILTSR